MPFYDDSPVPNAEIEAAADAMRILSESPEAKASGGVNWHYLAQAGLEAALRVRGQGQHGSDRTQ